GQRLDDLARLRAALKPRLPEMADAPPADFGHRPRHESLIADGMAVLPPTDHPRRHLRGWMRPSRVAAGWPVWSARAAVRRAPPVAAGNRALLAPSEHSARSSGFLRSLLDTVSPADRVAVATGGAEVAEAFAALPFDHLVFTGSTAIGRKVMAAAAANLVPL